MEPGTIVEYIDQQKIICAVILEENDQRLRLLNEYNREVNQRANRLSHTSRSRLKMSQDRVKLVESLKTIASHRQALSRHIDVKEIWDVLHTLEEWIDLPSMTAFCFSGEPSSDHESAVIRAFFENRTYFKFSHDWFYPHPESVVENNIHRQNALERQERLVAEGGDWLRAMLNNGAVKAEVNPEIIDALKSYYLYGKESPHCATAKAILAKAGADNPEAIFSVMIRAGHWDRFENLDIYRYEIPTEFPPSVMQEASELQSRSANIMDDARRRDLTGLELMTIDGQGTLDFDDALSIEAQGKNWRVGVHIADVAAYVEKGGVIDQEVVSRGTSIYMPDRKIPMLPTGLAENLCSLVKDEVKPAISIMFTITPFAEVLDYEIVPSLITVQRQLTYSDADNLVEMDEKLRALHEIAKHFNEKRLFQGAVQILLPEIHVRIYNGWEIGVKTVERDSPGRLLVAEMMILANWIMARYLAENQMPAVFRSQPRPKGRLYSGTDEGTLFQNWMQRRLLSRVVLGTEPEHHSGLGLDAYTTATSPIRKYFDLVTQRQLRACFGFEKPYSQAEMAEIIQKLEVPLSHAGLVQARRLRFWILRYLEGKIGSKTEGIVLDKRRDGYTILLPNYLMETKLTMARGIELKPKDLVRITIQHVDAAREKLTVFLG